MFGWFKSNKPRKTAIRIRRIYEGVEMKPDIFAAPAKVTQATIDDMKQYPKRYSYKVMKEDGLDKRPSIKISEITPVEYIKEHDVDIICEVVYTHRNTVPQASMGIFTKLGIFIAIWSFIGLIGLLFWFGSHARQERIDSQCYYYTHKGVPTSIMIEGEEYKLNPDGSFDAIDRVFLNPWHEEMLRGMTDNDCIFIDTK